ncbi:hypothetical protein E7744_04950 [Citricoccus sp. SGAir0253]|uniref:hypothetical protein n=1 Tax=Citricoccus sp. SGAir0253 TaxID=2567881 RepID=UPI0010CD57A3|nr:hypothetical protein [Citricoccus sp. SGAir0253]QCU77629.1 hypothetical protein E7744_04950 [Citricoccus sp. SGAir0253]
MTDLPDQTPSPSTDPAGVPGAAQDPTPESGLVAPGTALPEGQPQPPSERISPLVFLAIEQALEFATEGGDVVPFLLGYIDEEQKGMWRLPGADEAQMREQIAQLSPRPSLAVSVFDARLEVDGQPHDAFVLEAFDDEQEQSATVIQLYSRPAAGGEDPEAGQAEPLGAPQLYANGENVLRA